MKRFSKASENDAKENLKFHLKERKEGVLYKNVEEVERRSSKFHIGECPKRGILRTNLNRSMVAAWRLM